jgi:large subunit ribosomal protein L23
VSRDPYNIIVKPHITERTVALSYGDPLIKDEKEITRKYTFIVKGDANKVEIKKAFEWIHNQGKKPEDFINIVRVHTISVKGKKKRVGQKTSGYRPDRKKAIITLKKGQMLEDYGV